MKSNILLIYRPSIKTYDINYSRIIKFYIQIFACSLNYGGIINDNIRLLPDYYMRCVRYFIN